MGETSDINNVLFYKGNTCRKRFMVNEIKLVKTGEAAIAEVLTLEHLPAVLALHETTRAALPDDQKMFVLPQSPAYFEKFLAGKGGAMLGVTAGGTLIAQLVLMGPLTLEDAIANRAVTRNEIAFHHVGALDDIVAVKSMAVHPEYRGNELSQHLLAGALELPLLTQVDHVFAQISVDNVRSWELFLKNGFGIVAAGVDPGDQKARFILQKPAGGFTFDAAPSADDVDAVADFSAIARLTQREALVGHIDDMASTASGIKLAFSASAELSSPLPRVAHEAE